MVLGVVVANRSGDHPAEAESAQRPDATALAQRGGRHLVGGGFAKLVHGYRRLAFAQTDDALCLHVDLSVPRITRHFFPDPTGEVEFLIRVLQLDLCKHYTI